MYVGLARVIRIISVECGPRVLHDLRRTMVYAALDVLAWRDAIADTSTFDSGTYAHLGGHDGHPH